jgi:invasion protein IalB
MARCLKVLAIVVAAWLVLSDPAVRASEHEVWYYQCMEDEETSEKICTTEIATSSGARDFLIYFVHNEGGKSPLVVTGGEERFSGLTVKVDKEDPVEADQCDVGICYFEVEKSRLLLRQFRKGRRARISIINDQLDFILDSDITLRGFSASYAKH